MNDESFREEMRKGVQECKEANTFDSKTWVTHLQAASHYVTADFIAAEGYKELSARLDQIEKSHERAGKPPLLSGYAPLLYGGYCCQARFAPLW